MLCRASWTMPAMLSGATACSASAWTLPSPSSPRATPRPLPRHGKTGPMPRSWGVTGSLIHDTDLARTVLSVELGVLGPLAQGKEVQNGFHDIIGDTPNQGWGTQLRDEPIFEITPSRTWRVPLGSYDNVSFDTPAVAHGRRRQPAQLRAGRRDRADGAGAEQRFRRRPDPGPASAARTPLPRPSRSSGISSAAWMGRRSAPTSR